LFVGGTMEENTNSVFLGVLGKSLRSDISGDDLDALNSAFDIWKADQRRELWAEFTSWFAPEGTKSQDILTSPEGYIGGLQTLLANDIGVLRHAFIRKGLLTISEDPPLKLQWDRFLKSQGLYAKDFWEALHTMDANGRATRTETVQSGYECEVSSLFDLSADDIDDWLVDGMLPCGGFSILGAKPKVGKSTYGFSLGWSIARGAPFLGRPTKQGKVLHFSLEGVRKQDMATIQGMGGHENHLIRFGQGLPTSPYDVLAATIEREQLSLVVIDTVFRFAHVTDLNDYGQVNNAFARLIELGQNTGCHILAVHHLRKSKGEDIGDQILGSTAIFGSVDTYMDYQAADEQGDRVLFTRQRYGADMPKTFIGIDVATGRLVTRGTPADHKRSELSQTVLDALPPTGTAVAKKDIVEGIKARRQDVYAAIGVLVELGLLGEEKYGNTTMIWAIEPSGN